MKPVRLSAHARSYVERRGFTESEVITAIARSPWKSAELGRFQCHMEFAFGQTWNGKTYATKQVRPVFVDEATEIVVVTVYTYYY